MIHKVLEELKSNYKMIQGQNIGLTMKFVSDTQRGLEVIIQFWQNFGISGQTTLRLVTPNDCQSFLLELIIENL